MRGRRCSGFGAVLLGAAALVLIIAAANVSTLLAMRATARRREMGIRTALGAGRGRLVRQLLTETLTLFLAGGFGGTLLAMAGTSALERLPIPADQGLSLELSPDVRVLLFSIAVSLAVGLVFGIVPALRSASRNPVTLLRTSSAGGGRRTLDHERPDRRADGLLARAADDRRTVRPRRRRRRIDRSRLRCARTSRWRRSTPSPTATTRARGRAFYVALRQRLEAAPGVESVTYADRIPLTMSNSGATVSVDGGGADGQQRMRMRVELGLVDSGYFETLGIRLFAGREFTRRGCRRQRRRRDRQRDVRAARVAGRQPRRRRWQDVPLRRRGRSRSSASRPIRSTRRSANRRRRSSIVRRRSAGTRDKRCSCA